MNATAQLPPPNPNRSPVRRPLTTYGPAAALALVAVWPLARTLDASAPGEWLVALLVAVAGSLVLVAARRRIAWRAACSLAALAVGGLALNRYGSYNGVLVAGSAAAFLAWAAWRGAATGGTGTLVAAWAWINAAISAALLVVLPEVNGAVIHLRHLPVPAVLGLYSLDDREFRVVERSQDYELPFRGVREIHLHSPVSGHRDSHVRLLLKPLKRPATLSIERIDLVNFVALDERVVRRLDGDGLHELERAPHAADVPIAVDDDGLRVGPIDGVAWFDLPLDPGEDVAGSPARRGSALRALVYWQIVFTLIAVLAPRGRPRGEA